MNQQEAKELLLELNILRTAPQKSNIPDLVCRLEREVAILTALAEEYGTPQCRNAVAVAQDRLRTGKSFVRNLKKDKQQERDVDTYLS